MCDGFTGVVYKIYGARDQGSPRGGARRPRVHTRVRAVLVVMHRRDLDVNGPVDHAMKATQDATTTASATRRPAASLLGGLGVVHPLPVVEAPPSLDAQHESQYIERADLVAGVPVNVYPSTALEVHVVTPVTSVVAPDGLHPKNESGACGCVVASGRSENGLVQSVGF